MFGADIIASRQIDESLTPMPRKAILWVPIVIGTMLAALSFAVCARLSTPSRILAGLYTVERNLEARVSALLILANGKAKPALLIDADEIVSGPRSRPLAPDGRDT